MDIIAAIDHATGCQHCGRPLGDSPSDDFCGQDCQQAWAAARTTPLVGYREPWDLLAGAPSREVAPQPMAEVIRALRNNIVEAPAVPVGQVLVAPAGTRPDDIEAWRSIDARVDPSQHPVDVVLGFDGAFPVVPLARLSTLVAVDRDLVLHVVDERQRLEEAVHRLSRQWAMAVEGLAPMVGQMAHAIAEAAGALHPLVESLEPRPPADPRERALWLRQHRNTGPPTARQRPPRTINARRSR